MKCNNCGKEISEVLCHVFNHAGLDSYDKVPIKGVEDSYCYYLESIPKHFTMFEFEEDYDDFINQIWCPHCDEFPFLKESIDIHETATIVFGVSKTKEINPEE